MKLTNQSPLLVETDAVEDVENHSVGILTQLWCGHHAAIHEEYVVLIGQWKASKGGCLSPQTPPPLPFSASLSP